MGSERAALREWLAAPPQSEVAIPQVVARWVGVGSLGQQPVQGPSRDWAQAQKVFPRPWAHYRLGQMMPQMML